MKYKNYISHDRLLELLSYRKSDGVFRWKCRRAGQPGIGAMAGCLAPDGYIKVRIDGELYQAHRLAWFYVTGNWPVHEIDHMDLNRSNNIWSNLREATHQQNMINAPTKRRKIKHSSPLKGAYPRGKKWIAHIRFNGKVTHLGTFETQADAHAAYRLAIIQYHGAFARAA